MFSKMFRIVIVIISLVVGSIILLSSIHPFFIVGHPYCLICVNPNYQDNIIQPNIFFSQKYIEEINPKGKIIISSELEKIKSIKGVDSKLDEIFTWEMQDWNNPLWENSNFSYYNGSLNFLSYKDNITKIRADPHFDFTLFHPQTPDGKFYGNDPYWIAYNKVGACQELSNLFSFMARQSGIESRTVQTVGHQWVEVNVSGKWKYYDPWCAVEHDYYDSSDGNLTFKTKWYNDTRYFRQNCLDYAYLNFNNEIFPNPIVYT
jgi:hypothetical protein